MTNLKLTRKTSLSGPREAALILVICLAQILALAGVAQTVAPLPIIGNFFNELSPARLPWLTAAYSLTTGTFVLPAGRLGDMYGHKRMYLIGFVWYAVFSVVAGLSVYVKPLSQGYIMLAISRAFQGVGPAILVPNALALIGRTYSKEDQEGRKHLCLGFFAASAPTGFVLGALFSTLFAQFGHWPWMFYSQALICACAGVSAWLVVPHDRVRIEQGLGRQAEEHDSSSPSSDEKEVDDSSPSSQEMADDLEKEPIDATNPISNPQPPNPPSSQHTNPHPHPSTESETEVETQSKPQNPKQIKFDTLGATTGVVGLILFNFAWNQAPIETWTTPYILITLILGVMFLCAFVYIELRVAQHPLLPLDHFNRDAVLALICVFCGWSSFGVWMYYYWRFQSLIRGYLPLTVVAQNSAAVPSGLLASLTTSYLLSRIPVRFILLISMMAFLTGITLLATTPVHQTYWSQTFLTLLIMPWGLDMSFPSSAAIVSAALPKEHQGTAASLITTVVNYSVSLSLGVSGSIVKHNGAVESVSGVGQPGLRGQAGLYPGGNVEKTQSVTRAIRAAWFFGVGLDVFGLVVAMLFVGGGVVRGWRRKRKREGVKA